MSLVIINAAPNLPQWDRKVERIRALSHTSSVNHKRKKDLRQWTQPSRADQIETSHQPANVWSQGGQASSRKASSSACEATLLVARLIRPMTLNAIKFNGQPQSVRGLKHPSNSVASKSHASRNDDDDVEDEDSYQRLLTIGIETFMSGTAFANDFGCYRGMRTEPFGVFPEALSPAIDYYAEVIVPSYSALWKIFNVNNAITQTYLEISLSKECTLLYILNPKIITDPTWFPGKPLSESFLKGYNIALSLVRQRLSELGGKIDATILVAVTGLAILAGALGDTVSFKIHARSLGTLVKAAGGFESFGPSSLMKSLLLLWESQWAYQPGMRVDIFPDARARYTACFPPFPFDPDVARIVTKLPIGFRRLAEKGCLSLRTLEILGRCADVSAGQPLPSKREQFHPEQRRFADFFEACPFLAPGYEDPPALEKFIVQALILYITHTWAPLRFDMGIYRATKMDLTMGLLGRPLAGEHEKDVMCWVHVNLMDAWQSMEGSGRMVMFGKNVFRQFDAVCGPIKDVEQTTAQVKLFFCNERFERTCRRCLEQAIAG